MSAHSHAEMVWKIADLLRGPYRPKEYGQVILPFTVLRRMDSVLEPTKSQVLAAYENYAETGVPLTAVLPQVSGQPFYNTSRYTMEKLGDPDHVRSNLLDYVNGFSANVRDIFDEFDFAAQVERLDKHDLLLLVTREFARQDFSPAVVSNAQMGTIFEHLILKFAESSNETAGEHFTPREVIELMVDLLFQPDAHEDGLNNPNAIRSVYDPTAGTGGMLSVADEHLRDRNPTAKLSLFGQEINASSYAICKADMVIKGQPVDAIILGNTLTDDGHADRTFNYCLSNPPYGVDWRPSQRAVVEEAKLGFEGRFGPGLPSISDGQMLFLLHLISKMRPKKQGGGRAGIVLNGSPLFTGKAGSGESEIRRWIIESDLLDAIVALPTDMFYNTGIATYVWILDNDKPADRQGKVQLIDGSGLWHKMRKSLGSKRKRLDRDDIDQVLAAYARPDEVDPALTKIFDNVDFGYRTITVERPLRLNFQTTPERIDTVLGDKTIEKALSDGDRVLLRSALEGMDPAAVWKDRAEFTKALGKELGKVGLRLSTPHRKAVIAALGERDQTAEKCRDGKGNVEPDPKLRDTENVPLVEDIHDYFAREVTPHVPDAWIDETKTKVGYEIPFTRHFYTYTPPRPLTEIDADVERVIAQITALFQKVEQA
ncbi:type I restriction-modification system subunit M [Serinicoccus sp. CUA-874]|uniref:type I restriction-modification system subunit M n=1 Tax=Serinicoccus sp. CUA-874 TaxID=1517939 RepID=UPI0039DFA921